MPKFRVIFDDADGIEHVIEETIEATDNFSALKWAHDWAYTCSDKHHYELEELS